jgi:tripeptidyl-peptidase I
MAAKPKTDIVSRRLSSDAIFPNKYYNGTWDCGKYSPPNVISISYGQDETLQFTTAYEHRQCNEYLKLGLRGVTVVYSTGDDGVAGHLWLCANNGITFVATFPASCPGVTAVGATQININSSVKAPESAADQHFQSGGGFSNRFSMPDYQRDTVREWFKKHATGYPSDVFNQS